MLRRWSQYNPRERVDQIFNAPVDPEPQLVTQVVLTSERKMRVLISYAIVRSA